MSDEQDTGGVRRFGRRDRKRSLDPRGPLFPPDEPVEAKAKPVEEPEPPVVEAPTLEPVEPSPTANIGAPTVQPTPIKVPVRTEPSGGKQIMANLLTVVF